MLVWFVTTVTTVQLFGCFIRVALISIGKHSGLWKRQPYLIALAPSLALLQTLYIFLLIICKNVYDYVQVKTPADAATKSSATGMRN